MGATSSALPITTVKKVLHIRGAKTSPRYSQPETRNPNPETRNQKPKTQNPKPKTRNQKPETNPTTLNAGGATKARLQRASEEVSRGLGLLVGELGDRTLRLPGASPSEPTQEGSLMYGASVRGRRFLSPATAVTDARSCAVWNLAGSILISRDLSPLQEGNHGANGTACAPCVAGEFKNWVGEGACTPCAAGDSTQLLGSTAPTDCSCPVNLPVPRSSQLPALDRIGFYDLLLRRPFHRFEQDSVTNHESNHPLRPFSLA